MTQRLDTDMQSWQFDTSKFVTRAEDDPDPILQAAARLVTQFAQSFDNMRSTSNALLSTKEFLSAGMQDRIAAFGKQLQADTTE